MLVITRRAGEGILIGDEIELQVIELSPSRVKLGIAAPRSLSILRKEIQLAAEENLAASQTLPLDRLHGLLDRLRVPRG
jgi:carbon storage regulator